MNPRLSIITVNFNSLDVTVEMIRSLERHLTLPYELIVVDNASRGDDAGRLQALFPQIRVVASPTNLGFAGGNNLGIEIARADRILLLNNDTEIEDDSLHFLVETLDAHPEAGAVCPKIRFFHPPRSVQFAGYTPLSSITLRNALIGFGEPDDGRWDTACKTPYAHGAAMMVRREAIERAGRMPEQYFLYYEELDWSVRIREAGFAILYDPRCTVYHKESRTTGVDSPLKSYYLTRNRMLFARRNRRGLSRLLSIAYQAGVALPKRVVVDLLRGRRAQAAAALRGARDFFRMKNLR